ncbi:hypothetical protein LZC95_06890 [Pendulispora brunnea]|uniref:Uncharacterized protein n=1 Tax=Pendulispora brunnea TaxID=2905690 RepID=A0ABZ2KNR4_9BACT
MLAAGEGSWTAIDPKGILGERASDTMALLGNPMPDIARWPDLPRILRRRMSQLSGGRRRRGPRHRRDGSSGTPTMTTEGPTTAEGPTTERLPGACHEPDRPFEVHRERCRSTY